MDKASPHYKSKKAIKYFEDNKDKPIPVRILPTSSSVFYGDGRRSGNIANRDLLILKYYSSFADFKEKISAYFRTKKFNLNKRNYFDEINLDNIC